ncbi:MAG: hypothetical protein IPM97_00780 [Bdellovibrionaceae bacterium]|nr:hypothetical protein [Pseudobdellovibrionaceae bacterium]
MKNFNMIQLFVSLFIGQIALAGGWSSGGGGLLKDAVNPWFLNNTPSVSYCILIDQKNFGASQDVARLQLTRAIQFWKEQFSHAVLPRLSKFGQLQIASQVFTETTCRNDPDIVFQFGVLNHQQKKFLKDPTEYAAISVRTNYDEVNLRGKGFVYVSPSTGPLAYDTEGVVKDAWSVNGGHLLYLTLLHELGHVFGLQHMGSYGDLMSEGFVESVLASATSPKIPLPEEFDFFSLKKASRLVCPSVVVLDRWQKYFGGQISDKCFQFVFTHDSKNELFGKTSMKVYVATSPSDALKEIQEIELSMDRFFPSFTSLIWLSKRQTVFDNSDLQTGINSGMLGISGLTVGKQGHFILSDGKTERSITVRFEQGRTPFFIDGVVDGKIVPLL